MAAGEAVGGGGGVIEYHTPQLHWLTLAEMHGTPTRRYAAGRRCVGPGCHARLSVLNPGPVCYACQKARRERERLRASASSGDAVTARTAPTPAPLPQRKPGPPMWAPQGTDGVTRAQVLEMLPLGVLVSGADIARTLGLSRSVVSKHVRNLGRDGHVIRAYGGRYGGYRRET